MRYVIDAHALIWHLTSDSKLGANARAALTRIDVGRDTVDKDARDSHFQAVDDFGGYRVPWSSRAYNLHALKKNSTGQCNYALQVVLPNAPLS